MLIQNLKIQKNYRVDHFERELEVDKGVINYLKIKISGIDLLGNELHSPDRLDSHSLRYQISSVGCDGVAIRQDVLELLFDFFNLKLLQNNAQSDDCITE